MNQVLWDLFQGLIDKDLKLLAKLEGDDFWYEADSVIFSLAVLFKAVEPHFPQGFSSFQSQLYGSNLNTQLQAQGWVVEVYQSSGKVSSSLYQLRRL